MIKTSPDTRPENDCKNAKQKTISGHNIGFYYSHLKPRACEWCWGDAARNEENEADRRSEVAVSSNDGVAAWCKCNGTSPPLLDSPGLPRLVENDDDESAVGFGGSPIRELGRDDPLASSSAAAAAAAAAIARNLVERLCAVATGLMAGGRSDLITDGCGGCCECMIFDEIRPNDDEADDDDDDDDEAESSADCSSVRCMASTHSSGRSAQSSGSDCK